MQYRVNMFNSSYSNTNALSVDTSPIDSSEIDTDKLELGDIILFTNHYYKADATVKTPKAERYEDWTHIDHTAMYAGKNKDGFHTILHAAHNEDSSDSNPLKPSGLSWTTLKPLENQKDSESGARYDVSFKVLRYNDEALRKKAYGYLKKWSGFRIPYDEKGLKDYLKKEDLGYDPERFLEESMTSYSNGPGKYCAAEYCARRNLSLVMAGEQEDFSEGMTCAKLIVLAYQIAEMDALIRSITRTDNTWVSDKHGVRTANPTEKFAAYLEIIGNKQQALSPTVVTSPATALSSLSFSSNTKDEVVWKTSDHFWEDRHQVENFVHTSFAVDASTITSASIDLYCTQKNNTLWISLGELSLPSVVFSSENKMHYQLQRQKSVLHCAFSSDHLDRLGYTALPRARCTSPNVNSNSHANTNPNTPQINKKKTRDRQTRASANDALPKPILRSCRTNPHHTQSVNTTLITNQKKSKLFDTVQQVLFSPKKKKPGQNATQSKVPFK